MSRTEELAALSAAINKEREKLGAIHDCHEAGCDINPHGQEMFERNKDGKFDRAKRTKAEPQARPQSTKELAELVDEYQRKLKE